MVWKGLKVLLYYTDLGSEEAVTLLLHIVVDDPRDFFLPDLEAVDIDVVLNVLKRSAKTAHFLRQCHQLGLQFTRL